MRGTLETSKSGPGKEAPAANGGAKGNPTPASKASGSQPASTTGPPGPAPSEDDASPKGLAPGRRRARIPGSVWWSF
jgi:hypothetical protein